jgi:hypothetical protein
VENISNAHERLNQTVRVRGVLGVRVRGVLGWLRVRRPVYGLARALVTCVARLNVRVWSIRLVRDQIESDRLNLFTS